MALLVHREANVMIMTPDSDADGICDYEDDDACSTTAVLDSPNYDYESGDNIDIQTSNSIFASNQIYANADVTYDAGFTISLTDGFHAHEGSIFHAFIEGCSNGDVNDKQSIEDSSLQLSQPLHRTDDHRVCPEARHTRYTICI